MTVTVVVPWRGGCPHREAAWEWVSARYAEHHPDWRIVRAPGQPEGPWCKAVAVMPAVAAATTDLVVMADADCWTDGLAEAVAHVEAGSPWAIPHLLVHRLTCDATTDLLAGIETAKFEQTPYRGAAGGGFIVASRDLLLDIPLDPRFQGWGQEDKSHGRALTRLAGAPWRGAADLLHLWHPPQPRISRERGSEEGWCLYRRYRAARHDRAAMRALIEEAHRESREPAEPTGADHPPAAVNQP